MSKGTLYNLVHSLSKGEKRKFKIELAKYKTGKSSNLSVLFDLYNKQEVFDESRFLASITDSKLASNLSYEKFRLQKAIITYLGNNADGLMTAKLMNTFNQVLILASKRQFELALKYAENGRKLAAKIGSNFFVHLFVDEKINIYNELPNIDFANQLKLINLSIKSENLYHLKHNYMMLYQKAEYLSTLINPLPEKDVIKGIKEITESIYYKDESLAIDLNCKENLYDAKATIYGFQKEYDKQLEYKKKVYDLNKEYIGVTEKFLFNYIASIINYSFLLIQLDKIEKANSCIEELNKISVKYKNTVDDLSKTMIDTNLVCLNLKILSKKGKHKEVCKYVLNKKNKIDYLISNSIDDLKNEYYNLIISNLFAEKLFEELINKQADYIDLLNGSYSKYCYHNIKLYTFLANYELKNDRMLRSIFDSYYYYCRHNGLTKKQHKVIAKLLRKLCQYPENKIVSKLCLEVLESFKDEDLIENEQINYFISWLEDKVNFSNNEVQAKTVKIQHKK